MDDDYDDGEKKDVEGKEKLCKVGSGCNEQEKREFSMRWNRLSLLLEA